MFKALRASALAVGFAFTAIIPAHAVPVNSIPGGTAVPLPSINYFGAGPQTIAPGITWSSTNSSFQSGAVYGYVGGYGFSANGFWDGGLGPMIGINSPSDSMTISFSNPVGAVGGFINWAPGSGSPSIAVYDSLNNLIESAPVTFLTGGGTNTGQFLGFTENAAIIGSFVLTDAFVGLTNLTVGNAVASVPEPETLPLLMTGLLGLVVLRRKKKAS